MTASTTQNKGKKDNVTQDGKYLVGTYTIGTLLYQYSLNLVYLDRELHGVILS